MTRKTADVGASRWSVGRGVATRIVATIAAVLTIVSTAAVAASAAPSSAIVPGSRLTLVTGSVSAAAAHGDLLYLATPSGGGAGLRAPLAGAFDPASGALDVAWPELESLASGSTVTAIVPDGVGGAYVAGTFVGAGGIAQPSLVHLTRDREVDLAFRPAVTGGSILDVARASDGTLYIVGRFRAVGGEARDGVAALDGATGAVRPWRPVVTPRSAGSPHVTDAELAPSGLYVAGAFNSVDDAGGTPQPRAGAAQLSLADGSALAWDPQITGATPLLAYESTRNRVYLGTASGTFTRFGAVTLASTARLAAVDATTGAYDPSWLPAANNVVSEIDFSSDGNTVFVGGTFTAIGAQAPQPTRNRLAALDATSGEATTWNANLTTSTSVGGILRAGDTLYATGNFSAAGGVTRCGAAAFAVSDDAALRSWDPALSSVNAAGVCSSVTLGATLMAEVHGNVWIGGTLSVANVRSRPGNLLAVDVAQDTVLDWQPDVRGASIRDMALSADGGTLYLGGSSLSSVNGTSRVNAAAVSATGRADGPGDVTAWDPAPNAVVNAVAVSPTDGTVYLGGNFASVRGGAPRARLAAFDPLGDGTPSEWDPGASSSVNDLVVSADGRTVYAGGTFETIGVGAATRQRVAALAADTGAALAWDAAFDPATPPTVNDLALDEQTPGGGVLYVAGRFAATRVGAAVDAPVRSNVAALRLSDAAATSWAPDPSVAIGKVNLDAAGTVLLSASSSFTLGADGVARSGVAAVTRDGQVTDWAPPATGTAGEVVPVAGRLAVGGTWTSFAGLTQRGLLVFSEAVALTQLRGPQLRVGGSAFPDAASLDATLTCVGGDYTGSWPFARTYRWLRDGVPIDGQTGATYRAVADDADHDVGCEETVANPLRLVSASGTVRVLTGAPAINTPPEIVGAVRVGETVSCTRGLWDRSPATYAFRWLLDDDEIASATASTLQLTAGHEGGLVACEVTASNGAGDGSPATSAAHRVSPRPTCEQLGTCPRRTPTCEELGTCPRRTPSCEELGTCPQPGPRDPPARRAIRLDLGGVRVDRRKGRLLVSVRASAAGTVTVKLTVRSGRRHIVVGRGRGRVTRAGRKLTISIAPTRAARRALRGRLRLGVSASLRPAAGGRPIVASARAGVRWPASTGS